MGVVKKILFFSPLPLLDYTKLNPQSQAFNLQKNGDFFLFQSKKYFLTRITAKAVKR